MASVNQGAIHLDFDMVCEVEAKGIPKEIALRHFANKFTLSMGRNSFIQGVRVEGTDVVRFQGTLQPLASGVTYEDEMCNVLTREKAVAAVGEKLVQKYGLCAPADPITNFAMLMIHRTEAQHNPSRPQAEDGYLLGCQVIDLKALENASVGDETRASHSCSPISVHCKIVRANPPECKALNEPMWKAFEHFQGLQEEAVHHLNIITATQGRGWTNSRGITRNSFFLQHDTKEARDLIEKNETHESSAKLASIMHEMQGSNVKTSIFSMSGAINEMVEAEQNLIQNQLQQANFWGRLRNSDNLSQAFECLRTMQQYQGTVTLFTDMTAINRKRSVLVPTRKVLTHVWMVMCRWGLNTLSVNQIKSKKMSLKEYSRFYAEVLNAFALDGDQSMYVPDWGITRVDYHDPPLPGEVGSIMAQGGEMHVALHDGIGVALREDGCITMHGEDSIIVSDAKAHLASVSPNGSMIACANGNVLTLHRLQYKSGIVGRAMASHTMDSPVRALAFSWNNMEAACSTDDGVYRLSITGAPMSFVSVSKVSNKEGVTALAYSQCGQKLACGPELSVVDLVKAGKNVKLAPSTECPKTDAATPLGNSLQSTCMVYTRDAKTLLRAQAMCSDKNDFTSLCVDILEGPGKEHKWGVLRGVVKGATHVQVSFSTCARGLVMVEKDEKNVSHISTFSLFPKSASPDANLTYSRVGDKFIRTSMAVTEDQRQLFTGEERLDGRDDCESNSSHAGIVDKKLKEVGVVIRASGDMIDAKNNPIFTRDKCVSLCERIPSLVEEGKPMSEMFVRSMAMLTMIEASVRTKFKLVVCTAGAPCPGGEPHLSGHCCGVLHCQDNAGNTFRRLVESTCPVSVSNTLSKEGVDAMNKLCAVVQALTRVGTSVSPNMERMQSLATTKESTFWENFYVVGGSMLGTRATVKQPTPAYGVSAKDYLTNQPYVAAVKVNYQSLGNHVGGKIDPTCVRSLSVDLAVAQRLPPWTRETWNKTFVDTEPMCRGLKGTPTKKQPDTVKFFFCHNFPTAEETNNYCKAIEEGQSLTPIMRENLMHEKFAGPLHELGALVSVHHAMPMGQVALVTCQVPLGSLKNAVIQVDTIVTLLHAAG